MATKTFIVAAGRASSFPMDMLRYDSCWPDSTADAEAIRRSLEDDGDGQFRKEAFRIRLRTEDRMAPTKARWASFMWRVED